MQTTLQWSGLADTSLENCRLTTTETGWEVRSTITGMHERAHFNVMYLIRINQNWQTVYVESQTKFQEHEYALVLESDGHGNWTKNGKAAPEYKDCIDIDLPISPFTNTLPINRLQLGVAEIQEIRLVYLDVLGGTISVKRQHYTRLSDTAYKYENVPNDFEAIITVDKQGLVVDYPGLFTRTR